MPRGLGTHGRLIEFALTVRRGPKNSVTHGSYGKLATHTSLTAQTFVSKLLQFVRAGVLRRARFRHPRSWLPSRRTALRHDLQRTRRALRAHLRRRDLRRHAQRRLQHRRQVWRARSDLRPHAPARRRHPRAAPRDAGLGRRRLSLPLDLRDRQPPRRRRLDRSGDVDAGAPSRRRHAADGIDQRHERRHRRAAPKRRAWCRRCTSRRRARRGRRSASSSTTAITSSRSTTTRRTRGGATYPWLLTRFAWTWETPWDNEQLADFARCDADRGAAGNSLYVVDNYPEDLVIPNATDARRFELNPFLIDRLLHCRAASGVRPNFAMVNFYEVSDIFSDVDILNGFAALPGDDVDAFPPAQDLGGSD